MKQLAKDIFHLDDLTSTRKVVVKIALFLSIFPGLIFIFYDLLTDIEGPNPFIMAAIFMAAAPTVAVGLLTYLFADTKIKRKTILTVLLLLFQFSLLPIIWGINDIKLRVFLYNNQTELEQIANNLLDDTWTLEEANRYIEKINLPIRISGHIEEDETVLFFISGIIDNCHGIAFSRTGNEAEQNNCGELINWRQLKNNWYEWSTT